ncbi:MAG: F0F1 ATP synthase subunit B [Patescibacteria group bacterium]
MEAVGIAALGISWSAFIFQLLNFVVLLTVLRIFAYPAIIRVLEERKRTIDEQMKNAAEIKQRLARAHKEAQEILDVSRTKAHDIIHDAGKRAADIVQEAFEQAEAESQMMFVAAQVKLDKNVHEARTALKHETATLVVAAAEKMLGDRMTSKDDLRFIERSLL